MFSLSDVLVNWWHWWCCSWRWCLLFVGGVWRTIHRKLFNSSSLYEC